MRLIIINIYFTNTYMIRRMRKYNHDNTNNTCYATGPTKYKGRSFNRATSSHFQMCSAGHLEENGERREGGGKRGGKGVRREKGRGRGERREGESSQGGDERRGKGGDEGKGEDNVKER